jgi:hypothetical protein
MHWFLKMYRFTNVHIVWAHCVWFPLCGLYLVHQQATLCLVSMFKHYGCHNCCYFLRLKILSHFVLHLVAMCDKKLDVRCV